MSKFVIRNSCPKDYNKNYMITADEGWNTCVKGKPTKKDANALANCVGYASGRFNEIINIIRDTIGCTYKRLNCNAENFVERATAAGLQTGSEPRVGAIMCWQNGTLASKDGAGHVAIVEKVIDKDTVYTSESSYNGAYFFNATRKRKAKNGWGIGGNYKFRCFIYLPEDVQKEIDNVKPTQDAIKDENKNQPKNQIELGDTVRVSGVGTASSTGAGARTRKFINQKMKVIMIAGNTSRPNRYALNQYNKGNVNDPRAVTAWFSINNIKK